MLMMMAAATTSMMSGRVMMAICVNLPPHGQARTSSRNTRRINWPLYRAYLLKEQLREAVRLKGKAGTELLKRWLAWAWRCRLPDFVDLARRIKRHLPLIHSMFEHGLSNGRVEGLNTRLRLISRMAFGFHSATAFISLGMLKLGGLCPPLPGRA